MLAVDFNVDKVSRDEWRVVARLGSRDPAGIKRAMRKYDVQTIDELAKVLKHHNPERKFRHRLKKACGRMVGDYNYDPHKQAMKQAFYKPSAEEMEIRNRVKKVKAIYRE